jgi:signal transduction histidine kinase
MKRADFLPATVLIVGAVLATIAAVGVGTPARDAALLIGSTATFSIAVAIASRWYLARRGEASLRSQIIVACVASVATVAVGTLAAARAMFISVHDLNALVAVLTIAVSVAVAAALNLASSFDTDSSAVSRIAQRMIEGPTDSSTEDGFGIKEMRDLARRLDEVSVQLESSREREQALDRSRRELVSWVSHDLRSPLASIRALAEALEDGIPADESHRMRYYNSIRQESERLSALVDDLFELSRLQAGAISSTPETVVVQELVDDAVTAIRPRAELNGVCIKTDVDEISAKLVPAIDVTRALCNLMDNAVRHTRRGGVIVLEGHADGDDAIVISVLDECGGIPDSDLDRVFETAFRGDGARGRDGGGGLGLAIARGLVESHAGKIDVRNHELGCQFTIRIPDSHPAQRGTR